MRQLAWFAWVRGGFSLLGMILGLVGLGGIPSALRQWSEWINDLGKIMDQNLLRWAFVIVGIGIILAFNLPWRRATRVKCHGLPTKRRKEAHYRQRIQGLVEEASSIGHSLKKAVAWRNDVVLTLETLLADPVEMQIFLERTKSIADGKDIPASVERGVCYLRDIGSVDGGRLR